MAREKMKVSRTPWRWMARVLGRYDPDKRPRLAAWTVAAIAGLLLLSGVLGYVIPTLLVRG